MAVETGEKESMPRAMKVAIGLTVMWFVGLIGLLYLMNGCDAPSARWDIWHRNINCLEANTLGDFLAGVFAPVAFLWLVTTVFIQAQELKAQRHELRLTRNELELARGVAGDQRDALQEQAKGIAAQTTVLALEAEHRSREAVDREGDEILRAFVSVVMQHHLTNLYFSAENGQSGEVRLHIPKQDRDLDSNINYVSSNLFEQINPYIPSALSFKPHPYAREWARELQDLLDRKGSMTVANQRRIQGMQVQRIADTLRLWPDGPLK